MPTRRLHHISYNGPGQEAGVITQLSNFVQSIDHLKPLSQALSHYLMIPAQEDGSTEDQLPGLLLSAGV
jgi:hypothetical protein